MTSVEHQTPEHVHRVHRPARLWQEVVAAMIDRIIGGEFAPGSALPSEADLCDEFEVSRTVIRESLKLLEQKGLVRTVHGRGTQVLDVEEWSVLDPMVLSARLGSREGEGLFDDLTTVRIALESQMAQQAAERTTVKAVAQMRELIQDAEAAIGDPDAYLDIDVAFHDAVMRASGNTIARAIMATIEQPLRASRALTNAIPDGLPIAHDFHTKILDRIAAGDGPGAGAAMREHLEWSREHLHEYLLKHPDAGQSTTSTASNSAGASARRGTTDLTERAAATGTPARPRRSSTARRSGRAGPR